MTINSAVGNAHDWLAAGALKVTLLYHSFLNSSLNIYAQKKVPEIEGELFSHVKLMGPSSGLKGTTFPILKVRYLV
jgi:hypothetical protein